LLNHFIFCIIIVGSSKADHSLPSDSAEEANVLGKKGGKMKKLPCYFSLVVFSTG